MGVKILDDKEEKIEDEYDFVIISHVLEHVTEPISFLKSFVDKMKNGGHLFIEVPCMDWKIKLLMNQIYFLLIKNLWKFY